MKITRSFFFSVFCTLALTSPLHAVTVNPGGMIGGTNYGPFAWTDLGGGLDGPVNALAIDGADLYAGGSFWRAGSVDSPNVAKWDAAANSWTSLGAGVMTRNGLTDEPMPGFVYCLAHDGTDLYVGGQFETAGGVAANNVAKWDAATGVWTNMGSGLSSVSELLYDGANLYASGGFGVAKWDAADGVWRNLGSDLYSVLTLAHDGANLYAGGYVSVPGFVSRGYVVKWDEAAGVWTNLGSGMSGYGMDASVGALAHDGTNLYAGGSFTTADGVVANYVAKWDAAAGAWTNLGDGVNATVLTLAHDGANLYAGGVFTNAGGVAANCVAKWDAAAGAWTNLGSGMAFNDSWAPVYALAHDGTNLYAGGVFDKAGGGFARNLAKWGAPAIIYSGVAPSSGSNVGGYQVVVSGSNLGDGSDITSVTLCGVPAAIQSQSATQIVVTAGACGSAGPGAVRVVSVSFGETVKSNAFTYSGRGLTVLGSNGAELASGSAPVPASGAGFPPIVLGSTVTNFFSITNNGSSSTIIFRYTTAGADRTCFATAGTLGPLPVGGGRTFSVAYTPTAIGSHTAAVIISNNSPTAAYTVNLEGSCCQLSANLGRYSGGNTITLTNGNFGTVTNVLVGGVRAALGEQGAAWFSIKMPATDSAGAKDIVVQTRDNGDITLAGAYTYYPPGADQAIAFSALDDQWITNRVTLAATASSGLPVSYAVRAGPATLNELSNLTFTAGGAVTIEASQEGDRNWNPASNVTWSFTVLNVVTVLTDTAEVSVPEGGTASFRVKLSSPGMGDVVVTVARAGGDADLSVSAGSNLTFTTANWADYQTVILDAAEDNSDNAAGIGTFTIAAAGIDGTDVTATEADDDYTLTVMAANGTVAIGSGVKGGIVQPLYEQGTMLRLTATADESYVFGEWLGDATGADNPLDLTMDGDKVVTAWFVPVAPKALPPRTIAKKAFTARWQWVAGGAPEGELCVAADAGFDNRVPGYAARYVCNITECKVTNLVANRDYWFRVRRLTALSGESVWSKAVKVRTGKGMPAFSSLLFDSPVSKGVTQEFALTNLTSGTGVLTVKSTDANAVSARLTENALFLSYPWRGTGATARVTLTLKHPETGYKSAYEVVLAKAAPLAVVATGALTNAGKRVVQDVTLENRTGGPVYGVHVRVNGLNNPAWMINRSGFSMNSGEAIQEIPCVCPAGSQIVVRVAFHADYAKQAKKNPVSYWAGAVIPPLNAIPPRLFGLPVAQNAVYENDAGMRLLGFPVIGNRWYSVRHSEDAGANWVSNTPAIRATFIYMMWLDLDSDSNRVYQVLDAGM